MSDFTFTFKNNELDRLSIMIFRLRSLLEFTNDDCLSTMSFLKGIVSLLSRYVYHVYLIAYSTNMFIISFMCIYISYVYHLCLKNLSFHISNKTVVFLNVKVFRYYFMTKQILVICMNTFMKRKPCMVVNRRLYILKSR